MSEATLPRFECEGCGKSYKWKPELSLKRVKCKCGHVMTVPDLTPKEEDAPPALPDDDIFALIDNAPTGVSQAQRMVAEAAAAPPPPKAKPAPAAGKGPQSARGAAAVATLSGRPGGPPVLGYRGGPTPAQRQQADRYAIYDLKRDVYTPLALIAGSFTAYFLWLIIHGAAGSSATLAVYGTGMVIMMLVKTVLMIAGAFIVAPLAGVSFGPFWTAILKLAAVTIAPDVLVTILEQMMGFQGAGFFASIVGLACYWGLMCWLFQFEAAEAWSVVMLFGVLRWLLTAVLAVTLMTLFVSGGLSGGFGGGGDSDAATSASAEAVEFDQTVADMKENNLIEEGIAYIDRTGRQSSKKELINKLYDAGAKSVSFTLAKDINGKTEPLSLAVEWPRDAKKRATLLAAINDYFKQQAAATAKEHPDWGKSEPETVTDAGGKYVELDVITP